MSDLHSRCECLVICLECDTVIAKTYSEFEGHGKAVHRVMKTHQIARPSHTNYRVLPAPVPTPRISPKSRAGAIDSDDDED